MIQLLSIIFALIIGYFIRLPFSQQALNRVLNLSVGLILLVMGYDFGSKAANLINESLQIGKIVITFTFFLFIFNVFSTYLLARNGNQNYVLTDSTHKQRALFFYMLESAKYLFYVLIGIMSGYFIKIHIIFLNAFISGLLFLILFIVGYQLKTQGISLKQVIANRLGMLLAAIMITSSLLAGAVCALILHLSLQEGLMLASGFGWYTLSGMLSGQLLNHYIGTAAFFIDFFREMIAIILIPLFGRMHPIPFIAYSGATALDFTLPVIKLHLGDELVPLAITSGMILTLLVPLIIPFLFWLCST